MRSSMSFDSRTFPLRSINNLFFSSFVWFILSNVENTTTAEEEEKKNFVSKVCFSNSFFFFRSPFLFLKRHHRLSFTVFYVFLFVQFHSNDSVRGAANVVHVYDTRLYTCNTKGFWDFMWMCIDFIARVVLHLSNVK